MSAVWCVGWLLRDAHGRVVQHARVEWCASASGEPHDDGANNVPTKCGYFVVLPCGNEHREPTCPECVEKIKAGSAGDGGG